MSTKKSGRGDGPADPDRPAGEPAPKPDTPSPAAVLTEIGMGFDLWHDASGRTYATDGRRSYLTDAQAFRLLLTRRYHDDTGKAAGKEAVATALNTLAAHALFEGECREAAVRLAGHGGTVYLHLADPAGTVIEVDADGWRPCPDPPVRFLVPNGLLPLPMPVPGGTLDDLRPFVNLPDDAAFALLVAWVSAAALPAGPYPLAVVRGEQGSAKSTTTTLLKRLLDPAKPPARSLPRAEQDLMIHAQNSRVMAFDNLSGLPGWLSDAFCRLATGGGFAVRTLYANAEETIFDATRPVVLNGIPDFVERDDLLDRTLLLWHPRILPGHRRREREFWAAFDAAHPRLLGAVLDRVAGGLRVQAADAPPADLPRMADFAAWAVACERGAGEPPRFLAAYTANEAEAREQALAASPVAQAVVKLMGGRDEWAGPAADLLADLLAHAPVPTPKDWPRAGNVLTGALRRMAPALRAARGLDIDCDARSGGKANARSVRISRRAAGGPSAPSDTMVSDGADGADDVLADPSVPGDAWEPPPQVDHDDPESDILY